MGLSVGQMVPTVMKFWVVTFSPNLGFLRTEEASTMKTT
jgi:hypothetical protein